mmetsp:Transcript_29544/g.75743  ORF Transcript_29544/g.75743 Transcript_29544/m.75743 type:complete len:263 (-) Transcript_29544:415-1203(-)
MLQPWLEPWIHSKPGNFRGPSSASSHGPRNTGHFYRPRTIGLHTMRRLNAAIVRLGEQAPSSLRVASKGSSTMESFSLGPELSDWSCIKHCRMSEPAPVAMSKASASSIAIPSSWATESTRAATSITVGRVNLSSAQCLEMDRTTLHWRSLQMHTIGTAAVLMYDMRAWAPPRSPADSPSISSMMTIDLSIAICGVTLAEIIEFTETLLSVLSTEVLSRVSEALNASTVYFNSLPIREAAVVLPIPGGPLMSIARRSAVGDI